MTERILEDFHSILTLNSFLLDAVRTLGWWIILGLLYLVKASEKALQVVFDFSKFLNNDEVVSYINSFRPAIFIILSLTLVLLGYQFLLRKAELKKVVVNLLFAIAIVTTLPAFMSIANDLAFTSASSVLDTEYISSSIIKNNVVDVLLYDTNNFSGEHTNNIPEDNIPKISPTEVIMPKETVNEDVFKNRLVYDSNGRAELIKLEQGFLTVFKEYYYRYKINYGMIITTLLVVGFSLVFTSIKIGRIFFELAFHQLFACLIAFFDIASGQRLKKVLSSIFSSFAVIALTPVFLQFYLLGCHYIQANIENAFAAVLLLIAISFALIDGPNLVQSVLGIDAGISSAFKTMAGLFYGARLVGGGIQAAGRVAGLGINTAAKVLGHGITAGAGVAGIVGGARDAMQHNTPKAQSTEQSEQGIYRSPEETLPSGERPRLSAGTSSGGGVVPYGTKIPPLSPLPGETVPSPSSWKSSPTVPSSAAKQTRSATARPETIGNSGTQAAPASTQSYYTADIDYSEPIAEPDSSSSSTQAAAVPSSTASDSNVATPTPTDQDGFKSLGRHAVDYYKQKLESTPLYKNTRRAYEIGYGSAYGATERTLGKMEQDKARRTPIPMPYGPLPPLKPIVEPPREGHEFHEGHENYAHNEPVHASGAPAKDVIEGKKTEIVPPQKQLPPR